MLLEQKEHYHFQFVMQYCGVEIKFVQRKFIELKDFKEHTWAKRGMCNGFAVSVLQECLNPTNPDSILKRYQQLLENPQADDVGLEFSATEGIAKMLDYQAEFSTDERLANFLSGPDYGAIQNEQQKRAYKYPQIERFLQNTLTDTGTNIIYLVGSCYTWLSDSSVRNGVHAFLFILNDRNEHYEFSEANRGRAIFTHRNTLKEWFFKEVRDGGLKEMDGSTYPDGVDIGEGRKRCFYEYDVYSYSHPNFKKSVIYPESLPLSSFLPALTHSGNALLDSVESSFSTDLKLSEVRGELTSEEPEEEKNSSNELSEVFFDSMSSNLPTEEGVIEPNDGRKLILEECEQKEKSPIIRKQKSADQNNRAIIVAHSTTFGNPDCLEETLDANFQRNKPTSNYAPTLFGHPRLERFDNAFFCVGSTRKMHELSF